MLWFIDIYFLINICFLINISFIEKRGRRGVVVLFLEELSAYR